MLGTQIAALGGLMAGVLLAAGCGGERSSTPPAGAGPLPRSGMACAGEAKEAAASLGTLAMRLDVPFPPDARLVKVFDRGANLDVVVESSGTLDELVRFFSPLLDAQVGGRFRERRPEVGRPWGRRLLAGKEHRSAVYVEKDGTAYVQVTLLEESGKGTRQVTVARLGAR